MNKRETDVGGRQARWKIWVAVPDRDTNQPVTLAVDTNTKVHGVASAADLKVGQDAVVVSRSGTATQIFQRA